MVNQFRSCQVITSGGKEYVADDFQDTGHSPFAYFLIQQLKKNRAPYYSTKELALYLEQSVGNAAEQIPNYGILKKTRDEGGQGEFFFVRERGEGAAKDVTIRDEIPNGLEYKGKTGVALKWNVGTLEANESKTYRYGLKTTRTGTFENVAYAAIQGKTVHKASHATKAVDTNSRKIRKTSADGRFQVTHKGVIYDTETGLEWYVGPDKDTDHYEAERWVKNLAVDGGGWRLPSIEELRGIYQKGKGSRNMDPVFKTSGWFIWSGELTDSSSARSFDFGSAGSTPRSYSYDGGSFGVRAGRR